MFSRRWEAAETSIGKNLWTLICFGDAKNRHLHSRPWIDVSVRGHSRGHDHGHDYGHNHGHGHDRSFSLNFYLAGKSCYVCAYSSGRRSEPLASLAVRLVWIFYENVNDHNLRVASLGAC